MNISMPFMGGEARSDSLERYGKSAKRQIVLFFLSKHKGGKLQANERYQSLFTSNVGPSHNKSFILCNLIIVP